MILVSACLCGINCKYNGKNNLNKKILKLLNEGKVLMICPEQIGGLQTPREPCEIVGGTGADVLKGKSKVLSKSGKDCTKEFIKGAYESLKVAKKCNIKKAILKSKSPSCGYGSIYNGNFNGTNINGNGVTAELLSINGILVYNEENFYENHY
ncbi:hypothetical protein CLOACE_15410 [Clostridium acetireducens DSM 10703]|uniref:Uncharacterized protein n=1 Tax=Clostridium acetireducens DSM 10703 TaxID=1121290 RepID=A0A1E8EY61_9CLOT|nr:DUF523 domain-containing protein [Clostridium acetireducens]OFI05774.1 hypothetical protein CLOACE_15410 [Clostridium acetireducens DSM 10703]